MTNELVLENSFIFLFSQQRLIEEVEKITLLESDQQFKLWMHSSKLTELFFEQHKISLEDVIKSQGHGSNLREFLKRSEKFSIYGTLDPQQFYLALFSSLGFKLSQPRENKERNIGCKSYDLGTYLETILEEDTQSQQFNQTKNTIKSQTELIFEIASVSDLEVVLAKVIQQLWINSSERSITITTLSKEFYTYYKQPIRAVIRNVCPGIRLIEVLQSIPNLHVEEIENSWHVILK